MKNATHCGAQKSTPFINYLAISSLLLLSFTLLSCSDDNSENAAFSTQQQLLAELDKNQLIWANSGVNEYSLSLQKDCDCPEELKNQQDIAFNEYDNEDLLDDPDSVLSKASGISNRSLSARDEGERSSRQQSAQSLRVETLFTDLRQAILQNSVQQVSYNSAYGYPQNVLVNAASNQPFNIVQSVNRDSDDNDNRNSLSNLSVQAVNFQVLGTNNNPRNISLNGQLIRQNNQATNVANPFWLVDDDGRWNQLNAPATVFSTINNLPNQTRVQVSGQWLPGGINGQGFINLQQINPNQQLQTQGNLSGTLYYTVQNSNSFQLGDFYVTSDAGRNVFLNLPANLQNQALQLAGQRVNLTGTWTSFANDPNARFAPNGLNTANNVLEQFSGILTQGSAYSIPGVQQSNYILIGDNGSVIELQIPANAVNGINNAIGQRVIVVGTRINAGAYGQPIVYVQGINQQQNVFTNTQISGVISAVLPANGYSNVARVMLQLDSGTTINVQIPSNFSDPYNPLNAGMRIQVNGAWISNTAFGQGEFEVRSPVQITSLGINSNTTYSGYISNVGSVSNGVNCNATQSTYGFTTDNGQQFQLYVSNSTLISGLNNQGLNLPYQARVQVTGTQLSPGILQAQSITVAQQIETTLTGTIIEIGAAGNTFTCTGVLNTYRLLDTNGNAYSITTSPNTVVQGSQGNFLRIGDTVQVRGAMASNGATFNASQVIAIANTNSGNPYPNYPTPNIGTSTFVGIVTDRDCIGTGSANTYLFVDQSGTMYTLNINNSQAGSYIDIGTSLQVTGTLINNEITAQQVTQLQTFADPLNRIPVSGSILSIVSSQPTRCGTSIDTYQFQNDNGQVQQLRVSNLQKLTTGSRVTIAARVNSINQQLIDAVEIQLSSAQSIGNGVNGQTISLLGTITATSCTNEYYFVDQNGTGYQLQMNANTTGIYVSIGTRLNVSGQIIGNRLIATNAYADQSRVFVPTPTQASGTIISMVNTETLNCGGTVTTYTFQNDNGRTQRLRVASSVTSNTGQYLTTGSRVIITNKIESFDGSVIDALSISQQTFF